MKSITLDFLATTRAEIDFQSVDESYNPYELGTTQYVEYSVRFNELKEIYEDLNRSAA